MLILKLRGCWYLLKQICRYIEKIFYGWAIYEDKNCRKKSCMVQLSFILHVDRQNWIFIGRTDAEAETLILWPPDVKSWLIWKAPDAGKDWRWEEKGTTENEMVGWHHRLTQWTWVSVNSWSWWWRGRPRVLQSMGSQRVGHN